MLQDIFPSFLNNQYDSKAQIKDEDLIILINKNTILIKEEMGQLIFPTFKTIKSAQKDSLDKEDGLHPDYSEMIYAFSVDEERFFIGNFALEDNAYKSSEGFYFRDMKELREASMPPKKYLFAAYTAKHLVTWYENNRFCGKCGSKLMHSKNERAMCCEACNNTIYPKIMPAVIVGVINKDRLLITRYARGYNRNALIAGFTEIGETLEETVSREVMEEAGIKVKNIRYYKSQPWGIASDILAGFFCEVDGDDTIRMDENELKFAQWLLPEEIELQPDESSLTNEMMKLFKTSSLH